MAVLSISSSATTTMMIARRRRPTETCFLPLAAVLVMIAIVALVVTTVSIQPAAATASTSAKSTSSRVGQRNHQDIISNMIGRTKLNVVARSDDANADEPTTTNNNKLTIGICGLQGKPRRCTVDTSGFQNSAIFLLEEDGDQITFIDIDFGPRHRYTCRSNHVRRASSSTSFLSSSTSSSGSSTCVSLVSSLGGEGGGENNENNYDNDMIIVGDMNIITRGMNARTGEHYLFGSTSVGGEICNFGPDATGSTIVVECKSESEYPPESSSSVLLPDQRPALMTDITVDEEEERDL